MNILIVEDEEMVRNALRKCIEELGHRFFIAKNGEEAIQQVTENDIDFVISDIMMPGISGLSLVSVLRNMYLCQMPIVLISTLGRSQMKDSPLVVGADDFISKPFSIADIAYVISRHVRPKEKN